MCKSHCFVVSFVFELCALTEFLCTYFGVFLLCVSNGVSMQAVGAAVVWEKHGLVQLTSMPLSMSAGAWHAGSF